MLSDTQRELHAGSVSCAVKPGAEPFRMPIRVAPCLPTALNHNPSRMVNYASKIGELCQHQGELRQHVRRTLHARARY
jgi:hypothetical protein